MPFLLFCLLLGLFGALLGLIRGMKRSVCRIITIALSLLFAVVFSGVAIAQIGSPETIIEAGMISDPQTEELLVASPALLTFVAGMLRPMVFLVFFIAISAVLWLVYGIISIFFLRAKRDKNGKMHKKRGIGALIGLLQGVLVGAFILTPVLGYVSVAVNAIDKIDASASPEESISASIPEYEAYKQQYIDDGITGALTSVTAPLFDMTSSFAVNGQSTNVRKEIAGFLEIYTEIDTLTKDSGTSGGGSGTISDKEIKAIRNITGKATESPVLSGILSDFLSHAAGKWKNGETFAGQEAPDIGKEMQPVMDALLEVFATTDSTYIKEDLGKLVDLLELLSKNGLLDEGADVMQKINESDFLKEALAILDGRYAGVRRELVAIGHRALAESMGVTADMTKDDVRPALEENCGEMVTGVTGAIREKGVDEAVGDVANEIKKQISEGDSLEGVSNEVVDKVAGYVRDKLNTKLEEDGRSAADITDDDVYDVLSEFVTDPDILDELLMSLTTD